MSTSSILPTLACTITSAGITSPSYAAIYASLQATFQAIYGTDAVIDPDSQDGEMLAYYAQAQYDSNQATIAAYNAYSPATAQGANLSSVVKINGLQREVATNSTAILTVVGVVGTVITNGLVGDSNSNAWALPASVVIPNSGSIDVTATCQTAGAVVALANSINAILTPTRGWQTANNAADADVGAPVETDAALRQRQSTSTALPAQALTFSIAGAIANLPGVTRSTLYENFTGVTNNDGIPGHSISAVVLGGDAETIAQTIANQKTPGTGTYGNISEITYDPAGVPNTINFFALTVVGVTVVIGLRALPGYVSTTGTAISQAVAAAIAGLDIGEPSFTNRLWAPANLTGTFATSATGMTQAQLDVLSQTFTIASITQARTSGNPAVATVANGPYGVGSTVIDVTTVEDFYLGCPVSVVMDNAVGLPATVAAISAADDTITLSNAVPSGRQLLTGAAVTYTSDLNFAFDEAAGCSAGSVTVTPT